MEIAIIAAVTSPFWVVGSIALLINHLNSHGNYKIPLSAFRCSSTEREKILN